MSKFNDDYAAIKMGECKLGHYPHSAKKVLLHWHVQYTFAPGVGFKWPCVNLGVIQRNLFCISIKHLS